MYPQRAGVDIRHVPFCNDVAPHMKELNLATIKSHLRSPTLRDIPIDLLPQVDSTNTHLKQSLTKPLPRICLTEHQTAGKGQTNQQWYSPAGKNIYLSIAFSHNGPLQMLEGFSLVVAIALVKALRLAGFANNLSIKWPNDIFYQYKKLAGILIETVSQSPQQIYVITGIGLNVNMQNISENMINQPWTSLALIASKQQDRNALVTTIIEQFFSHLSLFEQAGLTPFLDQWEQYDFLNGRKVALENANGIFEGTAIGINTRGQLLIKSPDGISAHTTGTINWL
jgi:BirA family biotin operon repressor/biotin-[acetyl-CoA-carboxylase] ligase